MGWAFKVICWLAAAYFLVCFHMVAGFPPVSSLDGGTFIYLTLSVVLFVLPFAKTLKVGTFFEYAARIEEVKSEVKEFKEETRGLLALQTSLISNVSQTVSHNVNVTIPSLTAAREAEEQLAGVTKQNAVANSDPEADAYIAESGGDYYLALMRLRREIEMEFRGILGKETSFAASKHNRKFLGLVSLWNLFKATRSEFEGMEPALFYVADICNASAHGQEVPLSHAREALFMGLRILDTLREIEPA